MSQHEDQSEPNITPADPLLRISSLSNENISKKSNWITHLSGTLYTLAACFLFTCSTFIIKQLGVDLLDALLVRFLLQASFTFIFVLYKNYTLLGGTPWQIFLQICCGFTGGVGCFLFYFAVRYIEISDAVTLAYTRVVWTVVLSSIAYRERPAVGTLLALPLTLIGVVFVTQPTFLFSSKNVQKNDINVKLRVMGLGMAFSCALMSAINVLLFKQLISTTKHIKPSVLNLQFTFAAFVTLVLHQIYKIFYLDTPISITYILSWRFLLSSVVCLMPFLASVLTQKAIKREHPAVFSLLCSADIIFALILQNVFTSMRSNLYALLGSALVIGSVVLIGISRIVNERRLRERMKQIQTNRINEKNSKC